MFKTKEKSMDDEQPQFKIQNDEANELEDGSEHLIELEEESQAFQDEDIDYGFIVNPMERSATELEMQETIIQMRNWVADTIEDQATKWNAGTDAKSIMEQIRKTFAENIQNFARILKLETKTNAATKE